MWEKAVNFIRDKKSFLLSTHVNPEGDAIGSEIAMRDFLRDQGKDVVIVNSSPTPLNCRFLDPEEEIRVYPVQYDPEIMQKAEALIILDVNWWVHLGPFADEIKKSGKPGMCIDHHEKTDGEFMTVMINDPSAASAGLLVYELIKHMGGRVTQNIAEALYASLITDTGTFRFSNTDERAFKVAAELCSKGADPFKLHRLIFGTRSWEAGRLISLVFETLSSAADGRLAWILMTKKMRESVNATYEDSDGLIDLVRAIRGVELCLFFKETEEGEIKISLRSNGKVDANEIARKYGGGGHRMAAGMSIKGSMDEVVEKVTSEILAGTHL